MNQDRQVWQQAIFGYNEGHNLIVSSVSLNARTRQFLANVTDRSGPGSYLGFDAAITGLPLPYDDYYAVFCTWHAPEMSRPGCVWSHVLLVPLADLARVPDLSLVGQYFSRPRVPFDFQKYTEPVQVSPTLASLPMSDARSHKKLQVGDWLRVLYERPEAGVVVADDDNTEWDQMIFKIWSQQWPRLRREFCFSTGSLFDRRVMGIRFDIQIAPRKSIARWSPVDWPTLMVDAANVRGIFEKAEAPSWVPMAVDDIQNPYRDGFRAFLYEFGSDVHSPRQSYASLANVYLMLVGRRPAEFREILRVVGDAFPDSRRAVRLKRMLLGENGISNDDADDRQSWEIIEFLLSDEGANAFPFEKSLAMHASRLWRSCPSRMSSLLAKLVKNNENDTATLLIKLLTNDITPDGLSIVAKSDPELVPMFVSLSPSLAFNRNVWTLSRALQAQVIDVLRELSLVDVHWGQIVGAMCEAGTTIYVRQSIKLAGVHALPSVLQRLDACFYSGYAPPDVWRAELVESAQAIINGQGNVSSRMFALCAWCLPPSSLFESVTASDVSIQQLARDLSQMIPEPLQTPAAFLLVTLGLRESPEFGLPLIANGFFVLHDALRSGDFTMESWELLSAELPDLGWWKNWDRCGRLEMAVAGWFKSHHVDMHFLIDAASTDPHLSIALGMIESQ